MEDERMGYNLRAPKPAPNSFRVGTSNMRKVGAGMDARAAAAAAAADAASDASIYLTTVASEGAKAVGLRGGAYKQHGGGDCTPEQVKTLKVLLLSGMFGYSIYSGVATATVAGITSVVSSASTFLREVAAGTARCSKPIGGGSIEGAVCDLASDTVTSIQAGLRTGIWNFPQLILNGSTVLGGLVGIKAAAATSWSALNASLDKACLIICTSFSNFSDAVAYVYSILPSFRRSPPAGGAAGGAAAAAGGGGGGGAAAIPAAAAAPAAPAATGAGAMATEGGYRKTRRGRKHRKAHHKGSRSAHRKGSRSAHRKSRKHRKSRR